MATQVAQYVQQLGILAQSVSSTHARSAQIALLMAMASFMMFMTLKMRCDDEPPITLSLGSGDVSYLKVPDPETAELVAVEDADTSNITVVFQPHDPFGCFRRDHANKPTLLVMVIVFVALNGLGGLARIGRELMATGPLRLKLSAVISTGTSTLGICVVLGAIYQISDVMLHVIEDNRDFAAGRRWTNSLRIISYCFAALFTVWWALAGAWAISEFLKLRSTTARSLGRYAVSAAQSITEDVNICKTHHALTMVRITMLAYVAVFTSVAILSDLAYTAIKHDTIYTGAVSAYGQATSITVNGEALADFEAGSWFDMGYTGNATLVDAIRHHFHKHGTMSMVAIVIILVLMAVDLAIMGWQMWFDTSAKSRHEHGYRVVHELPVWYLIHYLTSVMQIMLPLLFTLDMLYVTQHSKNRHFNRMEEMLLATGICSFIVFLSQLCQWAITEFYPVAIHIGAFSPTMVAVAGKPAPAAMELTTTSFFGAALAPASDKTK